METRRAKIPERGEGRKGWVKGRKTEGQRRNGRQKDGDTQRNTGKGGEGGARTKGNSRGAPERKRGSRGRNGSQVCFSETPPDPPSCPWASYKGDLFNVGIQKCELGLEPLQGEHPVGGAMFPRLPDSGLPLRPGQAGLGSGAVVHGLMREPWVSGGSGPRPGVGTELVHGTPPPPRPHCPGSLVPRVSLKKWGGIPLPPAHIDDSLLGLRHVRDDPVRDD